MDGALQSIIGLEQETEISATYLPFSMAQLTIYGSLPATCYVHATRSAQTKQQAKYQLQITDQLGNVLIDIKDFTVRVLQTGVEQEKVEVHRYETIWEQLSLANKNSQMLAGPVLVIESENDSASALQKRFPDQNIIQANWGKKYQVKNKKSL